MPGETPRSEEDLTHLTPEEYAAKFRADELPEIPVPIKNTKENAVPPAEPVLDTKNLEITTAEANTQTAAEKARKEIEAEEERLARQIIDEAHGEKPKSPEQTEQTDMEFFEEKTGYGKAQEQQPSPEKAKVQVEKPEEALKPEIIEEAKPAGKKLPERIKEGVRRGAKAFKETYKEEEAKRKEKKAEAKAAAAEAKTQKKAAKEAEQARKREEEEALKRIEKENVRIADEAEAARKQKETEKRKTARVAESISQAEKLTEKSESLPKKEANPWQKWGEQPRVSEKYFGSTRLTTENKGHIDRSLQNEIGDVKDALAQKWFEENKYKIEAKGIPITGLTKEAMIRLAMDPATGEFSKEVLADFEKNKDLYGADLLKIDNAKALGTEFAKDKVSPESQFLMLNHLEKRTNDLHAQIASLEALGGKENRDKAAELQKEMDNLFSARKELAEKATGRDLTKESLRRVSEKLGYESKEEYIKDKALVSQTELAVRVSKMNSLDEDQFAALLPKDKKEYKDMGDFAKKCDARAEKLGISEDQLYALASAGYKMDRIRKTGFLFFGRGMELTKLDGTKVKMSRKEFYANTVGQAEESYKSQIALAAQEELDRRWEQEETNAILAELSVTMDESVGGTEAAYKKLKQNLIEEHQKNPVREKTPKEQEKQDKEFGAENGKQTDILQFLSDALKGEGKFAKLTGELQDDERTLAGISRDYGLGIAPKAFKQIDAGSYKETTNRGGLIHLLIELMIKQPVKKIVSAA